MSVRAVVVGLAFSCCWCAGSARLFAQQPSWLSGYVLSVPLFSGATPLTASSASNFNRFRVTIEESVGDFSFEVAYENAVSFRQHNTNPGFGLGGVQSGGEWFNLQGTISPVTQEHTVWQHRFDRMNVSWRPTDNIDLRVGRQAISWGTTLFLTPADPFIPFVPADPFRLFRAGVDAIRLRIYPSALSSLDFVVRPTDTEMGEEVTALARGLTTWRNWELSAWGGSLYGDVSGAVGAVGAIGSWALRGEAVIREYGETLVGRGTIGVDRFFVVDGHDVSIQWEYQRDGLGAAVSEDYLRLLYSRAFQRGELQVFGRDETALSGSFMINPLWTVAGLSLWNLNDGSMLVAPTVAYSAGDETAISAGLYFGFGDDEVSSTRPLPSEYGLSGITGFLSVSWFF